MRQRGRGTKMKEKLREIKDRAEKLHVITHLLVEI